ncbi:MULTISPECIES: hypothetical protein [Lysinibacillus]|uniref:hypothetical protein n=1 Tax=Lysinibacillus TaxID=400634 RepID=UPI00214CC0BC|nr:MULTISPECIES: hypothetical protein [Lysinibacillus]UUV26102.1 hypothetical protein NP781_05665 [Lysinibacillus sp. FN11]UYB48975.1 hypothetical protein OCI51_08440 [Lysinibacillus capsici]
MKFAVGEVVGKLTIVEFQGRNKHSKKQWLCRCECGNIVIRAEGNLKNTKVPHCGCSPGWKGTNKRFKDLTGERCGRLTVKYHYGKNKYSHNLWYCQCDCGNYSVVTTAALSKGDTNSCGCLAIELTTKRTITHGMTNTRLYKAYAKMKERCDNPNSKSFQYYGGRGIKIHDIWSTFEKFKNWAYNNGYEEHLTIDRIDVNGDYEPLNCRWVTMKVQNNNKRNNLNIVYKGQEKTLKQWSEELNIKYSTLYGRIVKRGWDIDRAFETRKI